MVEVTLGYLARLIERGFAELREELRLQRAALNDLGRENVTPGEIASIHHDLNKVMGRLDEYDARLNVLEGEADQPHRP